jgi:hypothetical protein
MEVEQREGVEDEENGTWTREMGHWVGKWGTDEGSVNGSRSRPSLILLFGFEVELFRTRPNSGS